MSFTALFNQVGEWGSEHTNLLVVAVVVLFVFVIAYGRLRTGGSGVPLAEQMRGIPASVKVRFYMTLVLIVVALGFAAYGYYQYVQVDSALTETLENR